MSKESLTPSQMAAAKALDEMLKKLAHLKVDMANYKLGDTYILEEWNKLTPKQVHVHKTHMGFPVKYRVVYVSPEGVPHLRKLTSAGNPTGEAYLPPEAAQLQTLMRLGQVNAAGMIDDLECQRFVPDPDQLDSIILQADYDPMEQHKIKSKLFNDINRHNKRVAVSTGYYSGNKVPDFFKSLKPGDKFWTAPDKQYVIQLVHKPGREWEIVATDPNNTTVKFGFSDFQFKRLYREQPRSFKQEASAI